VRLRSRLPTNIARATTLTLSPLQLARYNSMSGAPGELDLRPALNVVTVSGISFFLRPTALLLPLAPLADSESDGDFNADGARIRARAKLCTSCATASANGRVPPSSYAAGCAYLIDMDYIMRHGPCPDAPYVSYLEQLVISPVLNYKIHQPKDDPYTDLHNTTK